MSIYCLMLTSETELFELIIDINIITRLIVMQPLCVPVTKLPNNVFNLFFRMEALVAPVTNITLDLERHLAEQVLPNQP